MKEVSGLRKKVKTNREREIFLIYRREIRWISFGGKRKVRWNWKNEGKKDEHILIKIKKRRGRGETREMSVRESGLEFEK